MHTARAVQARWRSPAPYLFIGPQRRRFGYARDALAGDPEAEGQVGRADPLQLFELGERAAGGQRRPSRAPRLSRALEWMKRLQHAFEKRFLQVRDAYHSLLEAALRGGAHR